MDTSHLGPLERAILRTLVAAEALGVQAVDAERIHRCLPYSTHLANVQAALQAPTALGRYLVTDGTRYALKDRPKAPGDAAEAERRAERAWPEIAPVLRGLGKLPWIEGLALAAPWALGQAPAGGAPADIALLAEGGRGAEAQAAFGASLRSRGAIADRIRLVAVFDADEAVLTSGDLATDLHIATLRPITHPDGWAWLRQTRSTLDEAFPNAPWDRAGPSYELAERLDGRLAALRRRLLGGGDEVITGDVRSGRRRLQLDRTLGGLIRRLAGDGPLHPPSIARGDARWAAVESWVFGASPSNDDAAPLEDVPRVPAVEPAESKPRPTPEASPPRPPKNAAGSPLLASRRRRGPRTRPLRTGSPASEAAGRRASRRRP